MKPNKAVLDPDSREAASRYLEHVLGSGHTLSKVLLEKVNFKLGTIFVLSPGPMSRSQMAEFNYGHFPQEPFRDESGEPIMAPVLSSDDQLVQIIFGELGHDPNEACLLENFLSTASSAWTKNAKSRIVNYGSEVYHLIQGGSCDEDEINDAVSEACRLPFFVGAIGSIGAKAASLIWESGSANHEQLRQLAEVAHCVFALAYDAEGYVVWKSRD